MRVPLSWLSEYCDPGLEPAALADRLVMTGTEVERVELAGPPRADNFVVGKVTAAEQHPDADRLRVCTVEVGEEEPKTIVCGAPNVAAGQTVAVALPGARMPGGEKLRKAKLRGVASEGMILAADELGVGEDHEGTLVLDDALAAGAPLTDVIPLADPVLEIEVTPNRVDCFGVHGVAREVHAVTGSPLAADPWAEDAPAAGAGEVGDYAAVSVAVPELCPRFTARVFTEVEIGPSPLWLQQRLSAAGQRPINNVVDITNYVMLMTAQPLHSYDLDRVPGGELSVRLAGDGEKATTLDGVERTLDAETVLVCDREGPNGGIAGIMGGQSSEVSAGTTRVLLEAANWNGRNILRTSRLLGLRSEASARFEKQLHPALTMRAQRVASRLLVELCGARLVPGTIDVAAEPPAPTVLTLRGERVRSLLGMEISQDEQATYLERLGFGVAAAGLDLEVTVPPDRHFDVTREVDLIEEVARVHGVDSNLPTTLPAVGERVGRLARPRQLRRRAEDGLRDLGFDQVVSWSFTDPGEPGRLRIPEDDPRARPITISNPLSEDQSAMRTNLLGSLLDAAARNVARGAERLALYEAGSVYLDTPPEAGSSTGRKEHEGVGNRPVDPLGSGIGPLAGMFAGERGAPVTEPFRFGALALGSLGPRSWRGAAEPADFFSLKAVAEALAAQLGAELSFAPTAEPFLHPGRAAAITVRPASGDGAAEGAAAGWIGELHPLVARAWDVPDAVGFELDAAPLFAAAGAGIETYEDVTTFPAALIDLAVVVADEVSAAEVQSAVVQAGGELLRGAEVFDLYAGEQVGEGRKSLALGLELRAPDRTLTEEEVSAVRAEIVAALEQIGGQLRG